MNRFNVLYLKNGTPWIEGHAYNGPADGFAGNTFHAFDMETALSVAGKDLAWYETGLHATEPVFNWRGITAYPGRALIKYGALSKSHIDWNAANELVSVLVSAGINTMSPGRWVEWPLPTRTLNGNGYASLTQGPIWAKPCKGMFVMIDKQAAYMNNALALSNTIVSSGRWRYFCNGEPTGIGMGMIPIVSDGPSEYPTGSIKIEATIPDVLRDSIECYGRLEPIRTVDARFPDVSNSFAKVNALPTPLKKLAYVSAWGSVAARARYRTYVNGGMRKVIRMESQYEVIAAAIPWYSVLETQMLASRYGLLGYDAVAAYIDCVTVRCEASDVDDVVSAAPDGWRPKIIGRGEIRGPGQYRILDSMSGKLVSTYAD